MPAKMTYKTASRLLGGVHTLKKLIDNGELKIVGRGMRNTKMFNASEVYRIAKELRKPKEL